MNFRLLTLGISFALAIAATGELRGDLIRVYLQGGQSNADGRASVAGLPLNLTQPQSDVGFYFHTEGSGSSLDKTLTTLRPGMSVTGGFGPEITFGRSMADFYGSDPATKAVAIIKYANGATNLDTQWAAGGSGDRTGDGVEYDIFQTTVADGLIAIQAANPMDTVVVSGMIWHQGESDSSASRSMAYEANLTNFISDIRATYGADLPFVIGEIIDTNSAGKDVVRAAQAAVAAADPLSGFVDVDGFGVIDDAADNHFNASGQQSLGLGFASQMQVLAVPEPSSLALLGLIGFGFLARRKRASVL